MKTVLTPSQMNEVDRYMAEVNGIPSLILMENAAQRVAAKIMNCLKKPALVRIFCGIGNNGGDGLAIARILLTSGYQTEILFFDDPAKLKGDAKINFAFFEKDKRFYKIIRSKEELDDLTPAKLYVDALFGTGLSREITGLYKDAIEYLNGQNSAVLSVDIPSGIDAGSGAKLGIAVNADLTVTFQYPKIGHFLYPGRECTGLLNVEKIGIDDGCNIPLESTVCVYEGNDPDIFIGRRAADTNKGNYGRLLLVAGSYGMAGAAVLSAKAAVSAGAGLVTVASSKDVTDILQQNVTEATCIPLKSRGGRISSEAVNVLNMLVKGKTALALGPGLGVDTGVAEVVGMLVTKYDMLKIIDADALNILAKYPKFFDYMNGNIILTPHPAEFSRLSGLDLSVILEDPIRCAVNFATEHEVTVVLKGNTTVIADPYGNATLMCVGTPGMAKGGSGDVLTGLIAGFAAQGMSSYDAALYGVYVAGMAGERAAEKTGEYSMTPSDTIRFIGHAIKKITEDYIEEERIKNRVPFKRSQETGARPVHLTDTSEELIAATEDAREEIVSNDEAIAREKFVTEATKIIEKPDDNKVPEFLEKYMDTSAKEETHEEGRKRRRSAEKRTFFSRKNKSSENSENANAADEEKDSVLTESGTSDIQNGTGNEDAHPGRRRIDID